MPLDDLISKLNKKYGRIVFTGADSLELKFIPSEILALDIISGGGLPVGHVSEIWGKTSSAKSTISLKYVSIAQKMCGKCFDYLDFCKCKKQRPIRCFYIDAEGTYVVRNAESIGVNTKELIIARPDYLEQCMDICELAIRDEDVQFVIIDTIASLANKKEIEDSTADKHVAEGARSINQGLRKVLSAMNAALNKGRIVTLLLVNQVRENIGITWGNRDIKPGGLGQDFISCLEIKLKVAEFKYKGSGDNEVPYAQVIQAACIKNKYGIPKLEGKFTLDFSAFGDTNEVGVVKHYAERYGVEFGDLSNRSELIKTRRELINKLKVINVMFST